MRKEKQTMRTNKENPENYTPRYWPKNSVVNEQNCSILQDARIFRMVENVWTFLRVCLSGTVDPFITPWSGWLSNSRRERGEVTGHRSCATFVNHHPFTFPPFLKWMHYESVSFWSWDLLDCPSSSKGIIFAEAFAGKCPVQERFIKTIIAAVSPMMLKIPF
jgi:hypothetical protein